jgi:GTP-dependent phosphoenolpyruvate carboxykinase
VLFPCALLAQHAALSKKRFLNFGAFPMNSPVMQGLNLNTPAYVKNPKLVAWVAEMAVLCKPDNIYWCDGSEEEYDRLCQQLVDNGTFKKLNPAKRPGSFLAALTHLTWHALKTVHSSAQRKKKTQDPLTTGWPPPRCAKP